MIIGFLKPELVARCVGLDGQPNPRIWIDDKGHSALINLVTGKPMKYLISRSRRESKPVLSVFWIGNRAEMALIDLESEKVHGYVLRGGDGKYIPLVYVSFIRAIRLMHGRKGILFSLLSFPRCAIQLGEVRGMASAVRAIRRVLEGGA